MKLCVMNYTAEDSLYRGKSNKYDITNIFLPIYAI